VIYPGIDKLTRSGSNEMFIHNQVSIAGWLDSEIIVISAESGNGVIGVRLRAIAYAKVVHGRRDRR
jgi:hypothetical protein